MMTVRQVVESVVLDMITDHCIDHDIAPEDAGIFFSAATGLRSAVLRMADKHEIYGLKDPMEILAVDALVGIETASFRDAGTDDTKIIKSSERALLAVFILTIQTVGGIEGHDQPRG
jgi:hypothetical protein